MNLSFSACAGVLAILFCAQHHAAAQQSVPDAPVPQKIPLNSVQPGGGTSPTLNGDTLPQQAPPDGTQQPVGAAPQAGAGPDSPLSKDVNKSSEPVAGDYPDQPPPALGENGRDLAQIGKTIRVATNFVVIPAQIRDKNNQLVPGLTWRDFQIFEDNQRMRLSFFSSDPIPMSVALVVDQSLTKDNMQKVNEALQAITSAFAPYDELTVFTYANGAQQQTDYTAAVGDRIPAILKHSAVAGIDIGPPNLGGPLDGGPTINGQPFDPNLQTVRNTGNAPIIVPKELHTLNDAILAAGKSLSSRDRERRRVIYVVSDGKEQGSHVSQHEVIRYLLTNGIAVSATVVGDSAVWGLGYLDRIHLPLMAHNNILPRYALETGGTLDYEIARDGMERSFGRVMEANRTAYTLGYLSPTPATNPAERHIDVRVDRPNVTIQAKDHYFPTAIRQE